MLHPGLAANEVIAERFTIVGPLGRGGSGVTYEATDAETGARVALKRLSLGGLAEWKLVELFEREGRTLAMLGHPGIPRYVASFSVEEQGIPTFYLAQTLARGRSIEARLAEGQRFLEARVVEIADRILAVLEYLHAHSPPVVHRDIKPANLVLDDDGSVAVVDFGAVRDVLRGATGIGTTVVGTFGFMAPEQLSGVATPACDLYSLGATVLALATAKHPAELPTKKLRIEIPSWIPLSPPRVAWLRKMLEPAVEDRFTSAREARAALRTGKMPATSSPLRIAALLGVLAAVGVGGAIAVRRIRPRDELAAKAMALAPLPPRPWQAAAEDTLSLVRRIPGHASSVFDVGFRADGKQLVTASWDHTVKVWDVATGDLVRALTPHTDRVGGAQFTPDGRLIVSSGDRTLRVFDADTFSELRSFAAPDSVTGLDVDKTSGRAAFGCFDGNARIVSLADARLLQTLPHSPGKGRVFFAKLSPDGQRVYTGGDDHVVRYYDVAGGQLLGSYAEHTNKISQAALSTDGHYVATASDDKTVRVWMPNVQNRTIATLPMSDEAWGVAFSGDDRWLAAVSKDAKVRLFARPEFTLRYEFGIADGDPLTVRFSPDSKLLAIGHGRSVATLWAIPGTDDPAIPQAADVARRRAPAPDEAADVALYREAMDTLDSWHGEPGVLDEAEVLLKKAEKANPDSPWTLLARARLATSRGMRTRDDTDAKALASAKALVDRAEALAPKLGAVHVRRAWVLLSGKEYASARAAAQRALDLDPDDVDAEIISARIANADHAPEEAERRLFRVVPKIRQRATLALAYGDLIDAAVALHKYRRADALYRAAIELVPESAWQKGNYAGFLVWRREYTRAAEVAKSALAQLDYSAARWVLANAYVGEGIVLLWDRNDPEAARRYFDAAVVENPRNADAHYGLAAYHRVRAVRERSPDEAKASGKELRETLRIDPKHWAGQQATADQAALEEAARGR